MKESTKLYFRHSISLKAFAIGILTLVLLIPMSLVTSLIKERNTRKHEVIKEIASKWGANQSLLGPVIRVPVRDVNVNANQERQETDGKDKKASINSTSLYILPHSLDIVAELRPKIRYRSLYETVIYESDIALSGRFSLKPLENLDVGNHKIFKNQARLILAITDLHGIADEVYLSVNGLILPLSASKGIASISSAIESPNFSLSKLDGAKFHMKLKLRGTQGIQVLPVGKTTKVKFTSSWPNPSFSGAYLPEERNLSTDGFQANWKIFHYNRPFPQAWFGYSHQKLSTAKFGVDLLVTADIYQQSLRLSKYAIVLLSLTFIAFLFSEIITKNKVHPIQYILIGLDLLVFYVLLIAISEHTNFVFAYFTASVATIALLSVYASGVLKSKSLAYFVCGMLVILYLFFYILLQLEKYSLLLGSIGLFVVLAIIMYVTRNINWYETDNE